MMGQDNGRWCIDILYTFIQDVHVILALQV